VGVTYGFTGHPLVHQMAAMVAKGMLGDIRIVDMQYSHGFNSDDDDSADAVKWRTNPATAGSTFVLGDIGTHLYYLSEVVLPNLKIERLLCDRKAFIPSRAPLEDHATVLMHYDNGARGRLWVSSVNAGNMGSQRYRFTGSKASVEWSDSQPDQLIYEVQGEPNRILHHGMPYLEEESLAADRMGALHTEGLGDSWSNIYLWIAQAIDAKLRGDEDFLKTHHYPGIEAGTEGVRWLENCVRSADAGAAWVDYA
jgi:predicted dehydrogenase